MHEHTDEQLMMLVKGQDISAYERLIDRYEQRIFGFFWRLVADAEEARDCTQETFLRLWKGRRRYSPKGKFSSYLFQIAKNHLLNERHKRQSRVKVEGCYADSQESFASRHAPDASDEILADELRTTVFEAIARLPEGRRLVWVLSEHEGMSYKEIGKILNCSPATVCSRKAEAVEQLQAILAPLGEELCGDTHEMNSRT
ncbi:MAG: RNA polymerase sigma factor [Planctomycetota bacterium]|jgi:RNA polymerase sigma-70 factor (ECF subfamily)